MTSSKDKLEPLQVPRVRSKCRGIKAQFPLPQSIAALAALERSEPRSMIGPAPVGIAAECIMIALPLIMDEEAQSEGIEVLEQARSEVLGCGLFER